jgi:hypothetical protein
LQKTSKIFENYCPINLEDSKNLLNFASQLRETPHEPKGSTEQE